MFFKTTMRYRIRCGRDENNSGQTDEWTNRPINMNREKQVYQ